MNMKNVVLLIGGIDIVLLGVCLFLFLGKDRTAPVITFGENSVGYEEGMDEELLLEGVTAVDAKDGDVSGSLLVEKIAGTNGKEGIVTYVARDSSNNVGKASRAFPVKGSYRDGDDLPAAGEALDEENGIEESGMGETETETGTDSQEESSSAAGDEEDGREADAEANGNGRDEAGQEEEGEEAREEEKRAGSIPVLVMNGDLINTKVGMVPNWGQVIETMTDDKDDYNTLYNNLKLDGNVKLNEVGEYPVQLYTVDTDGNRSEVRNLVVKVEE